MDAEKVLEAIKILDNLVRCGIVTDVNNDKRLARVKFLDTDVTSGWLPVLANQPYIPDYLIIKPWMPKVNDQVVALYLPVFNADGFILGEVREWQ